jgi:hypothetical protein
MPNGDDALLASLIKQEAGHFGTCFVEASTTQTARHLQLAVAGRYAIGGDGGIRTPVQNRWPVASYVRSRHFVCHRGLLPTGSRCGEPNCLR